MQVQLAIDKIFLLWTLFRNKNYQMFSITIVTTLIQLLPRIRKILKRYRYPIISNSFSLKTDEESLNEIIMIKTDLGNVDPSTLKHEIVRNFITTNILSFNPKKKENEIIHQCIRYKDKFKIIYKNGYMKHNTVVKGDDVDVISKFYCKSLEYFNKVTQPINIPNDGSVRYFKCSRYSESKILDKILFCPELFTCYDQITNLIEGWKSQSEKRKVLGGGKLSMVFEGLPGCGKTLLAKHIAYLAGYEKVCEGSYNSSVGAVEFGYSGDIDKCVIVFDDIDVLWAYDRETDTDNGKETSVNRIKACALIEFMKFLDNASNNQIIIFTTNYYDRFDKALFRRGRVDARVRFDKLPFDNCKRFAINWYSGVYGPDIDKISDIDETSLIDKINNMDNKTATTAVLVSKIKNHINDPSGFIDEWNNEDDD